MPNLEEDLSRLQERVLRLQAEVETLKTERVHEGKLLALLLQAARGYRDAHAAVTQGLQQDFQAGPPGKSQPGSKWDAEIIEPRLQAVYAAQTILFAAVDMVQEETGR